MRLGELPASDPDVQASLGIWDNLIAVKTPSGIGYYRYGNDASKGSADGYGDCYQPSQTSCTTPGQPWPTTNVGTGHLWPVLSGERAESDIASSDLNGGAGLLGAMMQLLFRGGPGARAGLGGSGAARLAIRHRPHDASIGFTDGGPAGSAAPLSWAQAQELRLILDLGAGRALEQPKITADRYVRHTPPAAVPVTLTAPAGGEHDRVAPRPPSQGPPPPARTWSSRRPTPTPARLATTVTATAAADGSFSAAVPIGFGTNVLTVTAAAGGGTGYAQVTVVGDIVGGTTVMDVTDPPGDDNGPGTYQYPTAPTSSLARSTSPASR